MKRVAIRFGQLVTGVALLGAAGLAQTESNAGGEWQGKILIPDHGMVITVDLARSPKGAWIGSMSLAGSSAVDVPLSGLTVEGASVRFTADLPVHASFDGKISADGGTLSGTASSAAGDAPFQLTRGGEAKVKVAPPSSALSTEFEGAWEGMVDSGGKVRHIGLRLSRAADGSAAAVLIAVDSGNLEIPVTTVTVQGKDLQLEVRAVSGSYRGTLGDGGGIAGEWSEGGNRLPLNFKRAAH